MLKRIQSIFSPAAHPQEAPQTEGTEQAALLQSQRLELAEKESEIRRLRQEVASLRSQTAQQASLSTQASFESLMEDAASAAAQLATQTYLIEVEGKTLQTSDILAVARRLYRVLEDRGLTLETQIGQTAVFDPEKHFALSSAEAPVEGQPVIIRTPGILFQGRRLRKAGVSLPKS